VTSSRSKTFSARTSPSLSASNTTADFPEPNARKQLLKLPSVTHNLKVQCGIPRHSSGERGLPPFPKPEPVRSLPVFAAISDEAAHKLAAEFEPSESADEAVKRLQRQLRK
jgi:hypothetical protein